jgi:hypothetical protein
MLRLFRFTRSFILLAIVAVLAGTAACFVGAGRMIVDPQARATPESADVIFVLSGAGTDRWVEGHERAGAGDALRCLSTRDLVAKPRQHPLGQL